MPINRFLMNKLIYFVPSLNQFFKKSFVHIKSIQLQVELLKIHILLERIRCRSLPDYTNLRNAFLYNCAVSTIISFIPFPCLLGTFNSPQCKIFGFRAFNQVEL